jgi:hypothetical protein
MRKYKDTELVRILQREIKNVTANRYMDQDCKAAKIQELEKLIEENTLTHLQHADI